jgi:hypothetical protein
LTLANSNYSCIIPHMSLLNVDGNAKTVKGQKKGFLTGILYLAPANLSGYEVCPFRSAGCTATCLNTAGMGAMPAQQAARIRKTKEYFADKSAFVETLAKEIKAVIRKADKKGLTPVFRINGTSDMPALAHKLAKRFPDYQFYDYTKIPNPASRTLPNYHITFSLSENNWTEAKAALDSGVSVAVVFDTKKDKPLPETWRGYPVVDGDETDLRFLDPKGVIIGLRAKGKARKSNEFGFVQKANEETEKPESLVQIAARAAIQTEDKLVGFPALGLDYNGAESAARW